MQTFFEFFTEKLEYSPSKIYLSSRNYDKIHELCKLFTNEQTYHRGIWLNED